MIHNDSVCRVIWSVDPDMGFKDAKSFSVQHVDNNCVELFMPFSGPRVVAKYAQAFERAGYTVLFDNHTILIEKPAPGSIAQN